MRRSIMVSLLLAALMLVARNGFAHDEAAGASRASARLGAEVRTGAQGHTLRVLDLHATYRRASDTDTKKAALSDLVKAAASRQQRLASLIAQYPGEVLQVAISAGVRAALPAEVQRYVEEDVTVEGDLDVLHEDNDTGGRYVYWLRVAGTRLSVHFADGTPMLQSDDRVRVRAVRVQQALAVGGIEAVTMLPAAAPFPNTFGAQKTAVFLVAFQDRPTVTSSTVAQAQAVTFNASHSVSNFFRESSYGQTWLTGDVFGPFVIPMTGTSGCNYWGLADAADLAAAQSGVNLTTYERRVYTLPYVPGCGWTGLGTVGGNPSRAWLNGGTAAAGGMAFRILSHEMGHNLGLYHSHALDCGSVAIGGTCSSTEYGDVLDVMGSGHDHFNAAQKERLGWLNWQQSPPITDVTTTGVYTIDPYETLSAHPKALKIPVPGGDVFYVEYRQQALNGVNVGNGVIIHFMENSNANGIYLLDMTPATSSWGDPALAVGQSFTDAAARVTIAPVWVNDTGAGVNVTFGGGSTPSCVRSNPTVAVSPAQQQGGPGVSRTYGVAVTNNDTGCAAGSFSQQATVPSGWTATFGSSMLSIDSSATVSTTMTVQAPTSVSSGNYSSSVRAANAFFPSYAASGSALYVVAGSDGPGTFTDNFDRADADDLGTAWTKVSGALTITGTQLRTSTARALHVAVVPGLTGENHRVSASFSVAKNSGGPRFGVIVRYQDPNNYYSCYRQTGGASAFRIVKVVNGVELVLKSSPVANPASNAFWVIGCRAESSMLTLDYNGGVRISVSDASFPTGKVGLQMGYVAPVGRSVSLRADEFRAAP